MTKANSNDLFNGLAAEVKQEKFKQVAVAKEFQEQPQPKAGKEKKVGTKRRMVSVRDEDWEKLRLYAFEHKTTITAVIGEFVARYIK